MIFKSSILLFGFFLLFFNCLAQLDSTTIIINKLTGKYATIVDKKVDTYTKRISSKTEKTLVKLSKWEQKIYITLNKVNPKAANRLFSEPNQTFTDALNKYREGKAMVDGYTLRYDQYRDQLLTATKYLEDHKDLLNKTQIEEFNNHQESLEHLEQQRLASEQLQSFIKERKKQLTQQVLQYLGKSKYLQKISKENFYYVETLRNYKEIFNDINKTEEVVLQTLNKFPAFEKFMKKNSLLASLFKMPGDGSAADNLASLAGLQTRAQVNNLIQQQIGAGGPNALQEIKNNMNAAQASLQNLKNKVANSYGGANTEDLDFKPNLQKTKTLKQRLEFGTDFQTEKGSSYMPNAINVGLSAGYKINDKSTAGLGLSYRMGVTTINKFKVSSEGIGLRSFIDWKLKKQFFVAGGFEMNYFSSFKSLRALGDVDSWQQSALLGISKKIAVKTKMTKGIKFQLLYDFLYREHLPVSKPVVFRVGYQF